MTRNYFIMLTLFLSFSLAALGAGDPYPDIKAELAPRRATIGEPLEYRVNITGRDAARYTVNLPSKQPFFPGEKKTSPESKSRPADSVPLYIVHEAKRERRDKASPGGISVLVQIAFYRPGKHPLPEIEILDPAGARVSYAVPEVEILEVNKTGQAEDVEPPLDLGGNYTRLWILLAAAVAAGALGYGIYRFVRERRLARERIVPAEPPLDVFLREAESLRGKDLIEEGRIEEYVFGISMVFRRFLGAELGFDATDMTSEEILRALRKTRARADSDLVADCLNLWDLAKFAEFAPSKETLRANLESTVKTAARIAKGRDDGIPGV